MNVHFPTNNTTRSSELLLQEGKLRGSSWIVSLPSPLLCAEPVL